MDGMDSFLVFTLYIVMFFFTMLITDFTLFWSPRFSFFSWRSIPMSIWQPLTSVWPPTSSLNRQSQEIAWGYLLASRAPECQEPDWWQVVEIIGAEVQEWSRSMAKAVLKLCHGGHGGLRLSLNSLMYTNLVRQLMCIGEVESVY